MTLSSDFTQIGASAPPPPPLIGALLRVPYEVVRARMLAGLHQRGFTDLVAAHLDVIQYPGPDGQRPIDLAAHTRMSKQALNYQLGQLEELGYLVREADENDRRSTRIRLTPRGREAGQAVRAIVEEVEDEWRQQLGARDFDRLKDMLRKLFAITYTTEESG